MIWGTDPFVSEKEFYERCASLEHALTRLIHLTDQVSDLLAHLPGHGHGQTQQ